MTEFPLMEKRFFEIKVVSILTTVRTCANSQMITIYMCMLISFLQK